MQIKTANAASFRRVITSNPSRTSIVRRETLHRINVFVSLLVIVSLLSTSLSTAPYAVAGRQANAAVTEPVNHMPLSAITTQAPTDRSLSSPSTFSTLTRAAAAPSKPQPAQPPANQTIAGINGPGSSLGFPNLPLGNNPGGAEVLGGCNPTERPGTLSCGQPVNTGSGNFWHSFNELFIPGRGSPLQLTLTYNSSLEDVDTVNGPLGKGWTHNYNMFLYPIGGGGTAVHQENGSDVPFNYDYSHSMRVLASLCCADASYPKVFTHTHGLKQYFFGYHSEAKKLDKIVDRNNYTTTLTYSQPSDLLRTVTDPEGRSLTFTYTNSLLTSVSDPGNRTVSFGYTGGNLTSITDVAGHVTSFTYDANHRLLTMTDPNNGVLTNTYDSNSRVVSQTDPMSRTLQFGYSGDWPHLLRNSVTDTLGLAPPTVYTYTGYLISEIAVNPGPQQAHWGIDYAPDIPWPSAITDPNNHTWNLNWDYATTVQGNLLSITDPLTRTTSYAYNATNDVTTITNTKGITTTFGYDANGNLLNVTRPLTQTNELAQANFTYDPSYPGDVLTVTNPLNKSWGLRYDAYGNVSSVANPLSDTTSFTYDTVGRPVSVTTPRVFTATASYNPYGDPTIVTDTLGYSSTMRYDNNRNLKAVTDTLGLSSTFDYNLDNELTRVTQPDTTHSDYGYDGVGRVVTQTNGLQQLTQYSYDNLSRLSTVTDPLSRATSYRYDLAGNPTVMTDAKGLVTTYGYDSADQLRTISYSDSVTPNVGFDYNALGMRTAMTDGIGSSLYSYDSLGRVISATDGFGRTVGYHYDLASRLTALDYPDTGSGVRTVNRQYDAANRLTAVTDWFNKTVQFSYDLDSNLHYINYPTGVESVLTSDPAGQLTGIEDTIGGSPFLTLTYQRNRAGALTTANESGQVGTNNHAYSYDSQYHLTGDQLSGSAALTNTWTYDAATEIYKTHYITGGGSDTSGSRTYDKANELLTLVETLGAQTTRNLGFSYDKNGNRTQTKDNLSGQTTTYAYDQANRLKTFNSSYNYAYDGDGLRMSKSGPVSTSKYAWDTAGISGGGGLPLLLDDGAAAYIYGPGGLPLEEVVGNQSYYYHTDQLGSIRAMTDVSANVVSTYNYDAYGNRTSSTGSVYNPLGYAGEYTDSESGLVYLRARYYDPATQQFLSRDPLEALTEQPYSYAFGNPTNLVDPSGHFGIPLGVLCPECVIAGTVGGGAIGLGAYALTHQGCFQWEDAAKWTAIGVLAGFAMGTFASEIAIPWIGAYAAYWVRGGAAVTPVLGSMEDFKSYVLQPGETRLLVPNVFWSPPLNSIWIKLYLKAQVGFKTISDLSNWENLWDTENNRPTMLFWEVQQIVDAGHAEWIKDPGILP
jgi:RHS repeat-associated protein